MPPLRVSVPASELMREAEARVTAPARALSPEKLRRAPAEETPVPSSVTASAATVMPPKSRSSAPDATDVAPAEAPRPEAWLTASTPAETVVAPVKALAPLSSSVPEPPCVTAPPPLMTPLIVWSALLTYRKVPSLVIAAVNAPPLRLEAPPTSRTPATMSRA